MYALFGGDVVLYQHLFWVFGHPEVYILIIPAFAMISQAMANNCASPLFGATSMLLAVINLFVLGFLVWAHHMFTVGMEADTRSFFTAVTMLIGLPTGTKIFNWLLTWVLAHNLNGTSPLLIRKFFNYMLTLFNFSIVTFNSNAITMVGNWNTHNPASTFISALSTSVLSLMMLICIIGTTFPRVCSIMFVFSVVLWMHSIALESQSLLTAFPVAMSCSFASLIVSELMLFGTLLMCSFTMTAGSANGIHTIVSSLARTPFILTLVLCMLGVAMCFNMYYFLF